MRLNIYITALTLFLATVVFVPSNNTRVTQSKNIWAIQSKDTQATKRKDTRATLDIYGRVNKISVSPNEKIWLVTAVGRTYYTNNIDSNWHYGTPLFENEDEFNSDNPHLDKVSFFNNDTAIITGYISANKKVYKKNGYYLTKDGGKTWKLLDFGGDTWVYRIYTDKNGNAWMTGDEKDLFYSNNFGQSWTTITLPYKSSDRTYAINMSSSNSGIAGSDHNEIITTQDNWKTISYLPTPADQKKYPADELSEDSISADEIHKVLKWNNYLVVNQSGHIFYSDTNKINWKPFPIPIVDFEIDEDAKKLFAITDSLKIVSFSTPTQFKRLSNKRLSCFPIDCKVVNHSLYAVCDEEEVYKINEHGLIHAIPYTTDKKISEPAIVKRFSKLTWGINGNQIYLADDSKHNWYRENALNFSVSDFMLLSDSVAILWDGVQNNYLYSLNSHTDKIRFHFPQNPIKGFIASPVKSFLINAGSQGCFHSVSNKVQYKSTSNSTFTTSTVSLSDYSNDKPTSFKNEVSGNLLSIVLAAIDASPSTIPSIKDFQITPQDIKNYLALVDERLKSNETDFFTRKKKPNKAFYYAVPAMLDTIGSSIISAVLNQPEGLTSTTSNWFNVQIINKNNDTLNITRNYYVSTGPWQLPWHFEYKGLNFNCYNIEFSKFINACIPKKFMDKELFDNKILIMQIADYLYNKS